jgi:hypothetical protein
MFQDNVKNVSHMMKLEELELLPLLLLLSIDFVAKVDLNVDRVIISVRCCLRRWKGAGPGMQAESKAT